MATVLDLSAARKERTPHMHGPARCLGCQHEWEAVASVGAVWLQCPACSVDRGRFISGTDRGEASRWTCHCGNDLFRIIPAGTYCPNCGEWQAGFT